MVEHDSPSVIIGGTADHLHVLCRLSKTYSVARLIGEIKRKSSFWIKTQGKKYRDFYWQNGYAAFTVSKSIPCCFAK